jgi:hypothetical protein
MALAAATAQGATLVYSNLWSLAAGSRPYLGTANNERGIAVNPVTGHVLLASRTSGNHVYVLDGETGEDLGELSTSGVAGGTLLMTHIGVADDGAIYVCNLDTAGLDGFKIYRWADETPDTPPTLALNGDPASTTGRYGDSMDVRGSGPDTQIVVSGNGNSKVAVFTTTDGLSFTATELTFGAGISAGDFGKGLTFGSGNTLYGKNSGSANIRNASFNLEAKTLTLIRTLSADSSAVALSLDVTNNVLALVLSANNTNQANHRLKAYDISEAPTLSVLAEVVFPTPNANNGNLIGAVDVGLDKIVGLDPNNGIVALKRFVVEVLPPSITAHPASQTALEGGYAVFSINATGTKPLSYQWFFNTNTPVAGGSKSSLRVTDLKPENAGAYHVVVANPGGSVTSQVATLTVAPAVLTSVLRPFWTVPIRSRPYLEADNNHRGLAYNPVSGRVLLVSRTGADSIHVLDGQTGAHLHSMNIDPNVVAGGTFRINMVGVGEDGVVYACNLTTAAGSDPFKVYRWDSDSADALPTEIFRGDPGAGAQPTAAPNLRWGDTLAVRGAGADTLILVASRLGPAVCFLDARFDTFEFDPRAKSTDVPSAGFGLGLAFGAGDSFWLKAAANNLRQLVFNSADLEFSSVTVETVVDLAAVPGSIGPIGAYPSQTLLAGIGTSDTPDSLRLYDVSDLTQPPVWLDTEFFETDNENLNGTGAVAVGCGRVYALDSNNGLVAFSVTPELGFAVNGSTLTLTWPCGFRLYSASNVAGPYTEVAGAASPLEVNTTSPAQKYFLLKE